MKKSMEKGLLAALVMLLPALLSQGVLAENVRWDNVANARGDGNSLVKTGSCDGCPDAGATSAQRLGAGGGFVEFTLPDRTKTLYIGLRNAGEQGVPETSFQGFDYALSIQNGTAEIREDDAYRQETPMPDGAVFRIEATPDQVSYFIDGKVIRRVGTSPSYPLVLDVALLSADAQVRDVRIEQAGRQVSQAASRQDQGLWARVINAQAEGRRLVKDRNCDGCVDSGAVSARTLRQGQSGYASFRVTDPNKVIYFAVTNNDTGRNVDELDHAITIQGGLAEVVEDGAYRTDVAAAAGDEFRVAVEDDGRVHYYKNAERFYSSDKRPNFPVRVYTMLLNDGASVERVVIEPL